MTHEHFPKALEGDVIQHHHYFKASTTFLLFSFFAICYHPSHTLIIQLNQFLISKSSKMPRANDSTHKIFYKGRSEDFIVFVDDLDILQKWKGDRSIPLTDVLNGWKIFVTHG